MSLRELCRRHGVTANSAVMVQARAGGWAEKPRTYRDRSSVTYIQHHADRAGAREAEVHDRAIEAIDEAITPFQADLRATDRKLIDGEWVEVPVMRITPRDLALMIDRFQVLFGRPAMISEGRGFAATITSEKLPVDLLKGIIEMTRGMAGIPGPEASPPATNAPSARELSDGTSGSRAKLRTVGLRVDNSDMSDHRVQPWFVAVYATSDAR